MSVLIPVVSTGVTLNEIPNKIAYFIELGNCQNRCAGCHSPHLQQPLSPNEMTPVDTIVDDAAQALQKGAQACVVMGGTTNDIEDDTLVYLLKSIGYFFPVCLYSGDDDEEHDKGIAEAGLCRWLKTGSYKEELGGLTSPTTNQRFYRLEAQYVLGHTNLLERINTIFVDETHLFRKATMKRWRIMLGGL